MLKVMSKKPTAKDFWLSAWAWFKRNYGNIVLTLILLTLLYINGQLQQMFDYAYNLDHNLQNMIQYGIDRGADAFISDI